MVIYNHLWHQSEALFYYDVISRVALNQDHDFVLISKLYPYNVSYSDPWPELKEELIRKGKPVVMFLCSDEFYSGCEEYYIPGITTLIFKQYTFYHSKDHPHFRPIPLGLINSTRDFLNLPLNQRVYDYSFLGTRHDGRIGMQNALESKNDNKVKCVQFYIDWMDIEGRRDYWNKYTQILQNSKISLCPAGPRSNESFRIIESARCGCIIAATELIPHWYNLTCPYIKLDSWEDLSPIDSTLNKTENELQELSDKTYKWYQECLSSKAIAEYVSVEVNKLF